MLAFVGLSAFSCISLLMICLPCLINNYYYLAYVEANTESQWPWCCGLIFFYLCNLFLDLWLISDHRGNYLSHTRSCKSFFNALVTGAPIGFCLQRILASYDFFSSSTVPPVVYMVSSVLTLLLLREGLEVRLVMQLSSIPPTINPVPSCLGDVKDLLTIMKIVGINALLVYLTGTTLSKGILVCAALISLIVSISKHASDSLFVNLVLHPIDFEKLKPNDLLSGDINSAESSIFNGNYFYAVQNFNVVFLLNNLTVGLGLEGISYNDFMNSFENPLTILNHRTHVAKQRIFVDNLYLDTSSRVDVARKNIFTALSNCFGIPRPNVVSRRVEAVQMRGNTLPPPLSRSAATADNATEKGDPNLFQVLCRSFALRDLCRVARVSPFRRALIYRNPVLLNQTMYALCSLIDYHAVQVRINILSVANELYFMVIFYLVCVL